MSETPTERQAAPTSDEISLRDLYLILKRHALAIMIAAVVSAVVAFVVVSLQPAHYVAEATAVIARAPADVDFGSGLRFRPEVNIGLDTYRTLAFSRPVLQEVAERFDIPLQSVESRLELETLSSTTAFLAVDHIARADDAETAAAMANTWASISVQRARDLLLENLDAVEVIASEGLSTARSQVDALERELEARQNEAAERLGSFELDARSRREALTLVYTERFATLRLDSDLQSLQTQRTYLEGALPRVRENLSQAEALLSEQLALLQALRAAQAGGGDALVVLSSAPEVTLTPAGAVASVEAMVAAHSERRDALARELEGYVAEFRALARADEDYRLGVTQLEADLAVARAELDRSLAIARAELDSSLEREQSQLQRDLSDARRDYETLSPIGPGVALAVQIAPSGARVLSEATAPIEPEGNRAWLISVLALVVAGFAGVVLVLLAEAVRDPSGSAAPVKPKATSSLM
jgi:uncharacterized protein involved in exopolysaccharide biosynthesis